MLDLDHPNWLPFNDPVNQLVHTEDGTAVAQRHDRRPAWSSRTAAC